jgi:hypothetical protein
LTDGDVAGMLPALRGHATLSTLSMQHNNFTTQAAAVLAHMVASMRRASEFRYKATSVNSSAHTILPITVSLVGLDDATQSIVADLGTVAHTLAAKCTHCHTCLILP